MTYRGLQPAARWSFHMTGEWRAQFERVRRWHARLRRPSPPEERLDFVFAFFENAFHLRDWLLDTSAASRAELDALFATHVELRLCRDLANSVKHHSISRPSQPAPPSFAFEYTGTAGTVRPDANLVVLSDGAKYGALTLADRCLEIWEQFVETLTVAPGDSGGPPSAAT